MHFQAMSLGLGAQWRDIKKAYAAANRLCGDIVKVTPSSKVVGDLAQFMVQNNLSESDVHERAQTLSFPTSVIEYFQGYIGHPKGGFPEPLRSDITKGRPLVEGRPGAKMPSLNLNSLRQELHTKYSEEGVRDQPQLAEKYILDTDLMSAAMYPKEYGEYRTFVDKFGDVTSLPTPYFISPLKPGDELEVDLERGTEADGWIGAGAGRCREMECKNRVVRIFFVARHMISNSTRRQEAAGQVHYCRPGRGWHATSVL
jgi:pyruvate carboxylase